MDKQFEMILNKKIVCNDLSFDILCTLVSIDYPRSFVCRRNNKYYSFLEIENDNDKFGWNVCEVSLDDINQANLGKKNLQSLFMNKPSYQLLFINNVPTFTEVSSFDGNYSIMGNLFKPGFCDMDEVFDYHKLQSTAFATKENSLSIILEDEEKCSTGIIFKAINYLKAICANLKNPFDIFESKLAVSHGSTVISFVLPKDEGVILEGRINAIGTESINELGNLLSAYESDIFASLDFKNKTKALSKYEKLIGEFKKTEKLNPKIVLGCVDKKTALSYKMADNFSSSKKRAVNTAIKTIKDNIVIAKKEICDTGLLTGIKTKNENSFTFSSKSGVDYKGSVDFSMIGVDNFDVNGTIYEAIIEKIESIFEGNVIKTNYKLIKLKPIERLAKEKDMDLFQN